MNKQDIEIAVRLYKREHRNTGEAVSVPVLIRPDLKSAIDAEGIPVYHHTEVFRRMIFTYLLEQGNEAPIENVKQWIGRTISPYLTETDREAVDNGRLHRWEKQIDSARKIMSDNGLLTGILRKTWALTDRGREEAEKVKGNF